LNQSLRLDNRSSQTYYLLGAVYGMNRDHRKAEQYYMKAVNIFPDYAEPYYGLAKINFELNHRDRSEKFLEKCLSIRPGFPPALQLKNRLTSSNQN
jgi:tetratricopeptide (TPR) repeat protein